jgi:ABC-type Mn2+/Zn2+ transport system ATPase subunit
MDLLNKNEYILRNLGKINIILGKNGSGKSTALKAIETALSRELGKYKYITPERGGNLKYDTNLDHNIITNGQNWIASLMRNNQFQQFRQQSVQQYRKLEITILKEIEKIPRRRSRTFQDCWRKSKNLT